MAAPDKSLPPVEPRGPNNPKPDPNLTPAEREALRKQKEQPKPGRPEPGNR